MVGEKKVRQMLDPRTNLEDPIGDILRMNGT